jgi:hypothetical protein
MTRGLRSMWEHYTKMDGSETASDSMNWIPLAQDRHHGREIMLAVLMKSCIDLRFSQRWL